MHLELGVAVAGGGAAGGQVADPELFGARDMKGKHTERVGLGTGLPVERLLRAREPAEQRHANDASCDEPSLAQPASALEGVGPAGLVEQRLEELRCAEAMAPSAPNRQSVTCWLVSTLPATTAAG